MENINVTFVTQEPSVLFSFNKYFYASRKIKLTSKPLGALNITGREAMEDGTRLLNKDSRCDVLIIDGDAVYDSEAELIKKILTSNIAGIKKILFTSLLNKDQIEYFINNGVDGVISKRDSLETIEECIIQVSNNTKYTSRFIQSICNSEGKYSHCFPELNYRERQIISLRLDGKTNREIAELIHVSVRTVETNLYSAKVKLNLKHISDLIIRAARNLIPAVIPLLLNIYDLLD